MLVLHPAPHRALSSDVHDVLAAGGGEGAAGGLLDAARRLAENVLAPAAEATDRAAVVPASHLEALAAAGLMGLYRPPAAPAAVVREVYEVLAGACGVTFFVRAQHHAPVRMLAASANDGLRDRHLDDLCAGRVLGGVAFAYLRRPGPPAVVATPVAGGYLVDGEAPWVTSWALAGVFAVAARLGDQVLFFLLDAQEAVPPGGCLHDRRPPAAYRASPPLALAAMGASATVRLAFAGSLRTRGRRAVCRPVRPVAGRRRPCARPPSISWGRGAERRPGRPPPRSGRTPDPRTGSGPWW